MPLSYQETTVPVHGIPSLPLADQCGGPDCEQKPPMHWALTSQQSAATLHLSPMLAHEGIVLEQMSAPPSPLASQ
jgi:hypothetical protein